MLTMQQFKQESRGFKNGIQILLRLRQLALEHGEGLSNVKNAFNTLTPKTVCPCDYDLHYVNDLARNPKRSCSTAMKSGDSFVKNRSLRSLK